eukprot:scaffold71097_cov55-Cyclotella_meneghiniana.AAC.2
MMWTTDQEVKVENATSRRAVSDFDWWLLVSLATGVFCCRRNSNQAFRNRGGVKEKEKEEDAPRSRKGSGASY